MVDDPLWCLAPGLICDLPFIVAVLRQIGETSTEAREMLHHAAERLEEESRQLLPLLPTLPGTESVESDS